MTQPLGFDFALMSPLSKRPPHAVPREEMAAEIEQELADRRSLYPRLVAKGTLNPADAFRHIDIVEAIRRDLAGHPPATLSASITDRAHNWDAKIRELRREIALRRNAWPKRIAKPGDPLDEATAARRMERLEAVHFLYWIELFQCDFGIAPVPPGGECALGTLADTLDKVRAWVWRVETWEREAWRRGGADADAVRPRMIPFYQAVERGEPLETTIWSAQLAAVARHGFVQLEEAA